MPAEIMIAITAQRQEQCQSQQREGHQNSSLLGKSVPFHFCSPFQGVVEQPWCHIQTPPKSPTIYVHAAGTSALTQRDRWQDRRCFCCLVLKGHNKSTNKAVLVCFRQIPLGKIFWDKNKRKKTKHVTWSAILSQNGQNRPHLQPSLYAQSYYKQK